MKTIDEIRRENLLTAIELAGGAAKLAGAANVSAAYLSQIKNRAPESATGKPKAMGDEVARRIEVAINRPTGWMDRAHDEVSGTTEEYPGAEDAGFGLQQDNPVTPQEITNLIQLYWAASSLGRNRIMIAATHAEKAPLGRALSANDKAK